MRRRRRRNILINVKIQIEYLRPLLPGWLNGCHDLFSIVGPSMVIQKIYLWTPSMELDKLLAEEGTVPPLPCVFTLPRCPQIFRLGCNFRFGGSAERVHFLSIWCGYDFNLVCYQIVVAPSVAEQPLIDEEGAQRALYYCRAQVSICSGWHEPNWHTAVRQSPMANLDFTYFRAVLWK